MIGEIDTTAAVVAVIVGLLGGSGGVWSYLQARQKVDPVARLEQAFDLERQSWERRFASLKKEMQTKQDASLAREEMLEFRVEVLEATLREHDLPLPPHP